jgi:hypothetical protein
MRNEGHTHEHASAETAKAGEPLLKSSARPAAIATPVIEALGDGTLDLFNQRTATAAIMSPTAAPTNIGARASPQL